MWLIVWYFAFLALAEFLNFVVAQEDPLCSKIKNSGPNSKPIPISLEIGEGETFEVKCKFCADNRNDPVNWYFKQKLSRINRRKEYVEVDGPEEEITADPFTFDEFNRIFIEKDNSLIVRKFNWSDVGTYYCRKFPTNQHSGFEYKADVLLRKEALILPLNQNFNYTGAASLNLTREYHGLDREGRGYTLILNQLRVTFKPGNWSECSSCGETSGEQERVSECRVKFSFPHGEAMPKYLEFFHSPTIDDRERSNLEAAIFRPYSTLMQDYEELMSPEAIRRTCQEKAASRIENFEECKQKMWDADIGFNQGMGCRGFLFLNRWTHYASVDGVVFPPPELLGGLLESRTCNVNCTLQTAGRAANQKSKKFLKKKGINLEKIMEQQKKRAKVRKAKRHVISEYEGTGVKLSCPGAKVEQLLLWKNGTLDLNPYLVATETAARITYLNHLVLHIKNLTKYDCQVYSCWQNNTLLAEVQIKVVKAKEAPPDMRVALLYLAVGTLCDLLIFLALMIVRHRQRLAVRMKGYRELHEEDTSQIEETEPKDEK